MPFWRQPSLRRVARCRKNTPSYIFGGMRFGWSNLCAACWAYTMCYVGQAHRQAPKNFRAPVWPQQRCFLAPLHLSPAPHARSLRQPLCFFLFSILLRHHRALPEYDRNPSLNIASCFADVTLLSFLLCSEGDSVIEFRKPARVDISINEKTGVSSKKC